NRHAGIPGRGLSYHRPDRDRSSFFRGRHMAYPETTCGWRAAFRTSGFFRRSAPRCSLPRHCCHRQRRAPLGKGLASSTGDRAAHRSSPKYQSRTSLLQKPKRSLLFKSRPPVYWCAANSCNRKKNERLRASPDLRKVADARPSERELGLSAAGRVLKVKVKL